ncbi:16S rRNA (uracil(1498)-N(3))-methyltransferase [Lewinellaceae bacterium SD302]|nr:16S rRNA (uracil(1498)-N(3))-methyltransferase [Lewinellaceae bacterium SD302]
MQLFYAPDLVDGHYELPESEARHVVQVLRKRVGDRIDLVDGKGGWFSGQITETGKKSCSLDVSVLRREEKRTNQQVTLAFGPPKTADRLEFLLEKAVEIGVDVLQPFISHHSERRKLKPERLEKILESAMKQSLQAWLPELAPLRKFNDLLELAPTTIGLLAWIDEEINTPLLSRFEKEKDVYILIGPEGGFSEDEARLAIAAGFKAGSLGKNRLRTETAAIVALSEVANARLL